MIDLQAEPRLKTLLQANELGVRLEIVDGLPIWEAMPMPRHQIAVDRIRDSIRVGGKGHDCGCVHLADVYVHFPDGSFKRPDISIFCQMPEELDEAITLVPHAVIEIISKGFEKKDLEISPSFYLANGVQDIVVLEPRTGEVYHITASGTRELVSPVEIVMQCGCVCVV